MNRSLRALGLVVALLVVAAVALPLWLGQIAQGRLRREAAKRDLSARWEHLAVGWDGRLSMRGFLLTRKSNGDTVLVADSVGIGVDRWALLGLRMRIAEIGAAHATALVGRGRSADDDSLAVESEPADKNDRRANPERAARIRRSVESFVDLLFTPTRRLPAMGFRDVTLRAPAGSDALWSGLRLSWLESHPEGGGIRLAAVGALLGENELPFEASLRHTADDRIQGGLRVLFPASEHAGPEEVSVVLDGAVTQDRHRGIVTVHDSTRLTLGKVPLRLGATIARRGPVFHVQLEADDLNESRVKASLPAAVLGPLLDVEVEGRWDYRLGLDLDLARPDSVQFNADVIPHDLALDPERTRLRLLGLEEPFNAVIHLPRGRLVTRELSTANPYYRPLEAISPLLVSAVVTNEDGAFFRHRGFNTDAVKSAIAENLKAGAFRRGAGTITMQLARNLYLGHDRTLSRKFREVVLAWILEHLTGLSKQRLLEIYLNIIEWGPDIHGAGEAARYYFDRDPADLTVSEALFLTTVIPAPARWRSRVDASGSLRPFERAQMHFIGRAMIAKGWLAPETLPGADSLAVEFRGLARAALFPSDSLAAPDSTPGRPGPIRGGNPGMDRTHSNG